MDSRVPLRIGDLVRHKYGGPIYRVLALSANGHFAFVRTANQHPPYDRRLDTHDLIIERSAASDQHSADSHQPSAAGSGE